MPREVRSTWARRVERWRRSGLTAEQFAASEGVNARTLAFWKWRLKRDGACEQREVRRKRRCAEPVTFVEIASPAPPTGVTAETRAPLFELVLPRGYRVRIAHGVERGALTELLDVLEARR
jgi:transposase